MRAAIVNDQSGLVACFRGGIERVSLDDGKLTGTIPVPDGARTVAVSGDTGRVFVGSYGGAIYELKNDGSLALLHRLACRQPIIAIAISPHARDLVPVGAGTGSPGCSSIGHAIGNGWKWNAWSELSSPSNEAFAAAFAGPSNFVVGYTDGSMTIKPTRNETPRVLISDLAGAVRDIRYDTTSHQLIVVTTRGLMESVPADVAPVSNRLLAAAAQRLLEGTRALLTGLAESAAANADHPTAARLFTKVLNLDPESVTALNGAMCELWAMGYRDNALYDLQGLVDVTHKLTLPSNAAGSSRCGLDDLSRYGIHGIPAGDSMAVIAVAEHPSGGVVALLDQNRRLPATKSGWRELTVAACVNLHAGLDSLAALQFTDAMQTGDLQRISGPLLDCFNTLIRDRLGFVKESFGEVHVARNRAEQMYQPSSPPVPPRVIRLPPAA